MGIVTALLALQPDLGATVVVLAIIMGILFLGGISYVILGVVGSMVITMGVGMIIATPWRLGRVTAYLDPWNEENVLGKAYQLSHSLIAFGRGEIFGAGLGASVEKLNYLPEAHTDFIFAVIGEELGFVGVVCYSFTTDLSGVRLKSAVLRLRWTTFFRVWLRRVSASGSESRSASTWRWPRA